MELPASELSISPNYAAQNKRARVELPAIENFFHIRFNMRKEQFARFSQQWNPRGSAQSAQLAQSTRHAQSVRLAQSVREIPHSAHIALYFLLVVRVDKEALYSIHQ